MALDCIGDIALHGGIKGAGLLTNALFYRVELGIDQLESGLERLSFVHRGTIRIRGVVELCEIFHKGRVGL